MKSPRIVYLGEPFAGMRAVVLTPELEQLLKRAITCHDAGECEPFVRDLLRDLIAYFEALR